MIRIRLGRRGKSSSLIGAISCRRRRIRPLQIARSGRRRARGVSTGGGRLGSSLALRRGGRHGQGGGGSAARHDGIAGRGTSRDCLRFGGRDGHGLIRCGDKVGSAVMLVIVYLHVSL